MTKNLSDQIKSMVGQLLESEISDSLIQLQQTRKDFEGDITLVVFPLVKQFRKSPEQTAQLLGENIVEKIIEGQINKFFGEICLLEQVYVIDTDKKVGKVVEALAKELGGQVTLTAYSRFQLGEGIEKKEEEQLSFEHKYLFKLAHIPPIYRGGVNQGILLCIFFPLPFDQ